MKDRHSTQKGYFFALIYVLALSNVYIFSKAALQEVHIAQFGGLDVIYDVYTNAGTGEPRYVLTSLVDAGAVRATTFQKNLEA